VIVEGPLGASSSYVVGARRSYLDLLFRLADLPFIPSYTDLTFKAVSRPSPRDRLSVFGVGALDRVTFDDATADDRYENARVLGPTQDRYIAGVSWQRTLARGVVTTTLGRSWARFTAAQRDSGSTTSAPQPVFQSEATEGETSLRADLTYQAGPAVTLETGVIAKYASTLRYAARLPGTLRRDTAGTPRPLDIDTSFAAFRNATYAQATAQLARRVQLTGGLRADYYAFLGDAVRVSPRGALSYAFDDASALTLSGGRYWQAPPTAWLAGDAGNRETLRPFHADQAVLGYQRLLRPDLKLQVEGYVKRYRDYPARLFRPRAVLQPAGTDDATADIPFGLEPLVSAGRGRAWGAEAFVQKKLSGVPVYGLATVSVNRTEFRGLSGDAVRGAFDLPVTANALVGWRPNPRWELSARARGGSGLPTTPFVTAGAEAGTLDFARYNAGERLAPFFALDLRADRRWSIRREQQLVTYLDVQNATGRRNETFAQWDPRTRSIEQPASLGVLPSVGVTWEF